MNVNLNEQITTYLKLIYICVLTLILWAVQKSTQVDALTNSRVVPDSVYFSAERVEYNLQTRRVLLTGNALIRYRDIELRAGLIKYDQKTQIVEAESLPKSPIEKLVGLPLFTRKEERFSGTRMIYNLQTGNGQVHNGKATHQKKFYRGEKIIIDSKKNLHALELSLSSCNQEHVHYDFLCKNLKVLKNDKAIGRSVTFRIGPLPLFWFPFFVFPVKSGRHSGLLTPSFGNNKRDGLIIRNLGYYFAPSEYWDTTLRTTFRERGGFLFDSQVVYVIRQQLSGSANLGFENFDTYTGQASQSWRFSFQHQQQLSPTFKIRGNGKFSNNSIFNRHNSENLYGYLNHQLRSSFSIDKRWPNANRSIDASITYYRDILENQNNFQGFPNLSFRQSRRPLFSRQKNSSSQNLPWYKMIYYNLSGNLNNNFTRNPVPIDRIINLIANQLKIDPHQVTSHAYLIADLGANFHDLTNLAQNLQNEFGVNITTENLMEEKTVDKISEWIKEKLNTENLTLQGNLSVNSQNRIFGWLDLNPSLSVNQRLSRNDLGRPTQQESYVASLSSGATFYGILKPRVGRLRGIRHRLTPRMNFRYRQSATTWNGTFGFGSPKLWDDPTRSLDLNLGNTIELKTETNGNFHRFTLATINLFTGYDFDRSIQKWRPLRTSASVKPNNRMAVRISMSHSLYNKDNTLSIFKPRFHHLSITSNFRFKGREEDTLIGGIPSNLQTSPSDFSFEDNLYHRKDRVAQPWHLNLTHFFDFNKDINHKRSWIKLNLGFNPTSSWRINYGVNYSLLPNNQTIAQNFSFYRDLHCWESRFTWHPTGFNKGFFFKINIKDLPQIKLEHRRGGVGF